MEHVACLSYGKDSMAMLEAIRRLDYPLDEIIHVDMWATDEIPAQLPEMVAFKDHADRVIKERYGIEVKHVCAMDKDGSKLTFEKRFYRVSQNPRSKTYGKIYGWPLLVKGSWCLRDLKLNVLPKGNSKHVVYVGLALDEEWRRKQVGQKNNVHPLADIGWTEDECMAWCKENDLLSPVYEKQSRDGCWFCPKQSIESLRRLRRDYPGYWRMMLEWDKDSPVTFKADYLTLDMFERRFAAEDAGLVPRDRGFRWKMIDELE